MCEYNILKVRQYWICNGKEAKLFFYFSKWLIPPHKGGSQVQCFYRDDDDIARDDFIRGKRNALCFGNISEDRLL